MTLSFVNKIILCPCSGSSTLGPRLALTLLAVLAQTLTAEPLAGVVQAVDPEARRLTLQVDGEARTVTVSQGDATVYAPGDRIRGDLVPQGDDERLQTIWPDNPDTEGTIRNLGLRLQRDTLRRRSKVFRNVGEYMPAFALYDQNGDLFLSEALKGNYVVLNFIFSRCPMPDMCPAATERMKELDELLDAAGYADVRLVSVTLDPAYDTPGIWTTYAADKGIDTSRHSLLGGPAQIVEDLKKQLGVLSEPDPVQVVKHTMSTALIDPTGQIIYRVPGSFWSAQDFLERIAEDKNGSDETPR